ncbi:MAG TPA: hypothetical protein VJT09_10600, partial [Pyrinomonadaceae bacterium]|nr:hypothetical protein [Pyrinomonadaceae bacterium]
MADTKFAINVQFEGTTDKEKPENTTLYAFDAKGKLLGSAPVDKGQVTLSLPAESTTQAVRFFMGPSLDEGTEASVALVSRLGASEERLKLDPKNPKIQLRIPGPIWKRWPLCHCVVRGRVIKRQPQPDGTVRDLPICNSRVFIYEVDVLPNIILRLPDPIVVRLRDELIREVTRPIRPIPIPKPFPGGLRPEPAEDSDSPVASIALPDTATQLRVRALAQTTSISHIRQSLADLHLIIRPYLCLWPWLFPFFHTRRDLLRVVNVDENGNFVTVIPYLCIGDRPDLYFRVEQLQGGVWKTIYDPPLACHVYWNYQCGTEIIINITDPSAIACVPQDPVVTGETTWVMPYSVGGTRIWGTPPPGSPATPDGWVRSDGFTDYGVYRNAPFGATLAFRMGYSNDITTSTTIEYYRWSYRKGTTGDWTQMNIPVSRHYVKQVPGELTPSFPTVLLGPKTVGTTQNLFEFKQPSPPGPDASDPPGTTTAWPVDNWFDDIYAAFMDTLRLPGTRLESAGSY